MKAEQFKEEKVIRKSLGEGGKTLEEVAFVLKLQG